jgi:XTP/dITP diphosphohydrolase
VSATVVLATRNPGKIAELRRILATYDVELLGLDDFPDVPEVPETGETFEANALLKAHAVAQATGLVAVADDSGLAVDALNQMPGILSARWSGRHGDDDANLDLVLAQIADVPDERRGASFICAAAAATPDGREVVAEGQLTGTLLRKRRGSNGFGYDPIFVPLADDRTTAEMDAPEKDAISHRGKAFRALATRLAPLLWDDGDEGS